MTQSTNSSNNFNKWKSRSHYLGLLMSNAKGKSPLEKYNEACEKFEEKLIAYKNSLNKETKAAQKLLADSTKLKDAIISLEETKSLPHLSQTCKSKLAEIYTHETTGRRKVISSAYLEKGLIMEENAITDYSIYSGEYYKKNTVDADNDYITGSCDFMDEHTVLDTKCSWDIFTFDSTKFKVVNPIYWWQAQAYMWLYEKRNFKLVYSLQDTPAHLVEAQKRKFMFEVFGNDSNFADASKEEKESFQEEIDALVRNHTYSDLPLSRKIKIFNIDRDDEAISRIPARIEECRQYLNNIESVSEEDTD